MTPMPPMPSRSTPQGYHTDGETAELPPLPPEEADDDDDAEDSSESAETRPSSQMKKPRQPNAMKSAKPRPSADTAMKKAQFSISNFQAIPSMFQPAAPAVGLQFLLPIKPVSLKLPFNRRLEIEIYGRVVRPRTAGPQLRRPRHQGWADDEVRRPESTPEAARPGLWPRRRRPPVADSTAHAPPQSPVAAEYLENPRKVLASSSIST